MLIHLNDKSLIEIELFFISSTASKDVRHSVSQSASQPVSQSVRSLFIILSIELNVCAYVLKSESIFDLEMFNILSELFSVEQ